MTTEKVEKNWSSSSSVKSYADAVKSTLKSSSKSSVKSNTSLKSTSGSRASLMDKPDESPEVCENLKGSYLVS